MKAITSVARLLSFILHPLMMPLYGTLILLNYTFLGALPLSYKLSLLGWIFLFTYLIPAVTIYLLYRRKIITSVSLNNQKERLLPFLITLMSYTSCLILLYQIHLPLWILSYFAGAILAILIDILINLKWKISVHMTGIGGLLALIFTLIQLIPATPLLLLTGTLLLAGALGSARILMGRHTLGQVAAGTLNGFLCIYIPLYITLYIL